MDSHNFTDAVINFCNEWIFELRQIAGATGRTVSIRQIDRLDQIKMGDSKS